jgi:hypothetical protein
MTPYDVTPDDEPLDMTLISADDEMVESLRRSVSPSLSPEAAVVWDDDEDDSDPAYALLRLLQRDVSEDLPVAGSSLPPEVTPLIPRQRRFGRGTTVAAIAVGVISLGGVAAASVPGAPLAGVRQSIATAVSNVVQAITPSSPVGPATASPTPSASPSETPEAEPTEDAPAAADRTATQQAQPGQPLRSGHVVSAAARSAAAAKQVKADLDRAERFLDAKDYPAARSSLDAAAHQLPLVLDGSTHDALQKRLSQLRARLSGHPASPHPSVSPSRQPSGKGSGHSSTKPAKSHAPTQSVQPTHTTHVQRPATPALDPAARSSLVNKSALR